MGCSLVIEIDSSVLCQIFFSFVFFCFFSSFDRISRKDYKQNNEIGKQEEDTIVRGKEISLTQLL